MPQLSPPTSPGHSTACAQLDQDVTEEELCSVHSTYRVRDGTGVGVQMEEQDSRTDSLEDDKDLLPRGP